jgi:hypothetical protein
MNKTFMAQITLICISLGFTGYWLLQSKYSGKGLQVIENIFKETMPFEQALQALKEGHRIRRKTQRTGYTKIVLIEGQNRKEKFGTYWATDGDRISDHCSFSIEDVSAVDWVIDSDLKGE